MKLSVNENRKSKMIRSLLEEELRHCNKEERLTMADSVETHGVHLSTSEEVGSKRTSEKREVKSEILDYQEEQSFSQELHPRWVSRILLRAGMVPAWK